MSIRHLAVDLKPNNFTFGRRFSASFFLNFFLLFGFKFDAALGANLDI